MNRRFNKFSKPKQSRPTGPPGKNRPRPKGKHKPRRPGPPPPPKPINYEETGDEAAYLKTLVEAEIPVVVVLATGEKMRGIVRYYDRDVFSLGPVDGSPKVFLRKENIRYLYEEK